MSWTPMTERKPEKGKIVLVTIRGNDLIFQHEGETLEDALERVRRTYVRVTVGFIGSDGWYGADGYPLMVRPVAWMPMPEPYDGGEE